MAKSAGRAPIEESQGIEIALEYQTVP